MCGLIEVLASESEGLRASDAVARLIRRLPPTAFEASEYPNGGRRYEKIVRFLTIAIVKAGWLVKEDGRWYATEAGRLARQKYDDPKAFFQTAVRSYHAWKKSLPAVDNLGDDLPSIETTTATASITLEQAEDLAWDEIERYLTSMPPYDFQDLVAALLRAMGYHVGWIAPPGKDGGVDIIAYTDPLGTSNPRIKVQVKRQQQKVAVDGMRSFLAVLSSDDVGIFVNSGGFTKDAEDEARLQTTRRVTLLNLERFVKLWTEYFSRLGEAGQRKLPLQAVYFLALEG